MKYIITSLMACLLVVLPVTFVVTGSTSCDNFVTHVRDFSQGIKDVTDGLNEAMDEIKILVDRVREGSISLHQMRVRFDDILRDIRKLGELTDAQKADFRSRVERLLTPEEVELLQGELDMISTRATIEPVTEPATIGAPAPKETQAPEGVPEAKELSPQDVDLDGDGKLNALERLLYLGLLVIMVVGLVWNRSLAPTPAPAPAKDKE